MDAPDEVERVRAESLQRLAEGRLPVEAERRLQALVGRSDFFTSDLSVSEFALVRDCGLQPVSQVMGSCVYHASTRAAQAWTTWNAPGQIDHEALLARPYNEARRNALARLQLEAQACDADAVVGVRVTRAAGDYEMNSVEFVAIGTAVRVEGRREHGTPVLTGLSGNDYWRLAASGHWPVGMLAATEVVSCVPSITTQRGQAFGLLSGIGRVNRELEEFSEAIRTAIHGAVEELGRQATTLGAEGVVGVSIERHQETVERENPQAGSALVYGQGFQGYRSPGQPDRREDLLVIVHALGTAIVAGEVAQGGTRSLTIEPVRRLDTNRRQAR